jgi:UDP-N-acetyl-D-mannosaminuronate dehydrogenase
LPKLAVEIAKDEVGTLTGKNILILGMTYKRDSDDLRESLAQKIRLLIENEFPREINLHDPFVKPKNLEKKIRKADVIFVGTNHTAYDDLDLAQLAKPKCLVVDIWYQMNPNLGHVYYCSEA